MSAHPGLEKKIVLDIIRQEHHRRVVSGRAVPGLAGPVHHGHRLYGQKETFFVP